jgi:hypothetical protein
MNMHTGKTQTFLFTNMLDFWTKTIFRFAFKMKEIAYQRTGQFCDMVITVCKYRQGHYTEAPKKILGNTWVHHVHTRACLFPTMKCVLCLAMGGSGGHPWWPPGSLDFCAGLQLHFLQVFVGGQASEQVSSPSSTILPSARVCNFKKLSIIHGL